MAIMKVRKEHLWMKKELEPKIRIIQHCCDESKEHYRTTMNEVWKYCPLCGAIIERLPEITREISAYSPERHHIANVKEKEENNEPQ